MRAKRVQGEEASTPGVIRHRFKVTRLEAAPSCPPIRKGRRVSQAAPAMFNRTARTGNASGFGRKGRPFFFVMLFSAKVCIWVMCLATKGTARHSSASNVGIGCSDVSCIEHCHDRHLTCLRSRDRLLRVQ